MESEMIKSSKTGLSWPKEYRENIGPIAQLRKALKLGGGRDISNGQLFLLATVIAFNKGKIAKEKSPAAGNSVRVADLQDSQRRLLEAIAVSTQQSRKVLITEDEVFEIAERYAAEGLKILFEAKESRTNDDFALYVSSEVYSAMKANQP
jgi:hypothetical protein